jgi:hypothetical protein
MLFASSSLPALARLGRTIVLVAVVAVFLSGTGGAGTDNYGTKPPSPAPANQARYEVKAGLDGEIYPVFANYASLRSTPQRSWGTISVKVTNSSAEALRDRIVVQVQGWSDPEIQVAELAPGESHTYLFAPAFLRRTFFNHEIVAATTAVTVTDASGKVTYEQTVPVRLRSVDDLYWGRDFEYAPFIASWVTPHDAAVEKLLARAKEFMPGRRMPGYESSSPLVQDRSTVQQARAIYRALQEQGVSYVKSSMTLGGHEEVSERVRMPAESLNHSSANCIDGAVMYAALFENLAMEPEIVLVPGHAYVGVRLMPGGKSYLYIETSLTGRTTFEGAVASAERTMAKFQPSQLIRINIREARLNGIYPMPSTDIDSRVPVLDASRTVGHPGS